MLFGSRSGFDVPLVPDTPVPVVLPVVAPGVVAVADLSSTGADSSVGVVLQPARTTAMNATKIRLRIQPPTLVGQETKFRRWVQRTGHADRKSSLSTRSPCHCRGSGPQAGSRTSADGAT